MAFEHPWKMQKLKEFTGAQKTTCQSKVLGVTALTAGIFRLDCTWMGSVPRAGQFFMVKPRRTTVFLPRPISAAFWNDTGTVSFLILRRGRGTEELAALHPGEAVELSGPLGNCWEDFLPGGKTGPEGGTKPDSGTGPNKPLALVGGGIGIAPLLSLPAQYQKCFDFYAGFRIISEQEETTLLGPIKPSVNKLVIAIEHPELCGSVPLCKDRETGKIPDFLNPTDYSAIFACGPEAMLRAVAEQCANSGIPCYVSLERRMACGVGACLGCTVAAVQGNRRCCTDGPIFPASEVFF